MVESPKPEHFQEFRDWLESFRLARGLSKAELGRALGVPKQTLNKWYKGSKPGPAYLATISQRALVPYEHLRMLCDEQPITGTLRAKREEASRRHPRVEQLASRLNQLADDETLLGSIEDMIEGALKRKAQSRKRAPA